MTGKISSLALLLWSAFVFGSAFVPAGFASAQSVAADGRIVMRPSANFSSATTPWIVTRPDGKLVNCALTQTSCFQEALNEATTNGWSLDVYNSGIPNVTINANVGILVAPMRQEYVHLHNVSVACGSSVSGACITLDSMVESDFTVEGGTISSNPAQAGDGTFTVLLQPRRHFTTESSWAVEDWIGIGDSAINLGNVSLNASSGTGNAVIGVDLSGGGVDNTPINAQTVSGGNSTAANQCFYVFNAAPLTAFTSNIVTLGDVHSCIRGNVQIGDSANNALNYRGNQFMIGSIEPGAGGNGYDSFGSGNVVNIGSIDDTHGAYQNGVNLQSSSMNELVTVGSQKKANVTNGSYADYGSKNNLTVNATNLSGAIARPLPSPLPTAPTAPTPSGIITMYPTAGTMTNQIWGDGASWIAMRPDGTQIDCSTTHTSCFQEALNEAHVHGWSLDVYSPGGGNKVGIASSVPINIPPLDHQYIHVHGAAVACGTQVVGPCITFDSMLDSEFTVEGGQLIAVPDPGTDATYGVLMQPRTSIGGSIGITGSLIDLGNISSSAIGSQGGFSAGVVGIDLSHGSVTGNSIRAKEINSAGPFAAPTAHQCFFVFNATANTTFSGNTVVFGDVHLCDRGNIQLGSDPNSPNNANYSNNRFLIGGIEPNGTGAAAYDSFGSGNIVSIGGIENDQGPYQYGVFLQKSASNEQVTVGDMRKNNVPISSSADFGSGNHYYVNGVGAQSTTVSAPPTATLTANNQSNPSPITIGDPYRIDWNATNVSSCTVSYASADGSVNGTLSTQIDTNGNTTGGGPATLAGTISYTMQCIGTDGTTVSKTVIITGIAPPPAAPTATLTANRQTEISLTPTQPVKFEWSSTGGTSASAKVSIDSAACTGAGVTTTPSPWTDGNGNLLGNTTSYGFINAGSAGVACTAGHTITFVYTVVNAAGQSASATTTVHMVADAPTTNGSLSVSTDPSSPSYAMVAGGTPGAYLGIYKLHASGEGVNVNSLSLKLTSGSPGDLSQVAMFNQFGTLLGTAVFTGTNTSATSSFTTSMNIPKDTDANIIVKGVIPFMGVNSPATPGDLIKVDYQNAQGTGVNSGSTITGSGSTNVAGVRIFKSYPTVALVPLPTTGLADGRLMRFSVTANTGSPIGLAEIAINIAGLAPNTNGQVDLHGYTDSNYSSPIAYCTSSDCHDSVAINGLPISSGSPGGYLWFPKSVEIPAGQTYYFELRDSTKGTRLTNTSALTTTLLGQSTYGGLYTATSFNGKDVMFVWSPNDFSGVSNFTDGDWTNGYAVPGLPAGGISQVRTGGGTTPPLPSPAPAPTPAAPTIAFTAPSTATSIPLGGKTTISWTSQNAPPGSIALLQIVRTPVSTTPGAPVDGVSTDDIILPVSGSYTWDPNVRFCRPGDAVCYPYVEQGTYYASVHLRASATSPSDIVAAQSSAITVPSDRTTRDNDRKTNLNTLASALEAYKTAHGSYPVSGGWLCSSPSGCALGTPYWSPTLSSIPNLPHDYDSGQCAQDGNMTRAYYYISQNGSAYKIFVCAENTVASTDPYYDATYRPGYVFAKCGGTTSCATFASAEPSTLSQMASVLAAIETILEKMLGGQ